MNHKFIQFLILLFVLPISVSAYIPVIANDNLIASNDTEYSTTSDSYVPVSNITPPLNVSGTIRVKFDRKVTDLGGPFGSQIRKNGVILQDNDGTWGLVYDTVTYNLTTELNTTDILSVYEKVNLGQTVYVRNFRLYYGYVAGNWTFNNASSTSYANDSSGFNNNGSITNAVYTADNVNGSALSFDGTGDYVTIPNNSSLNITSDFTFAGWFKPSEMTSARHFYSKLDYPNAGYRVFIAATDMVGIATYDSGESVVYSNTTVSNNTWQYVQAIKEGNTGYVYINGVLVGSGALPDAVNTPNDAIIGDYIAGGGQEFKGELDEFKLYNYALNSSERTSDYQQFQPVPAYPTGAMVIAATYPPQTTSINFSWHDTEYPADEILVAKDSSFNLIEVDDFVSTDYKLATLGAGTHYWKVRQYNGTTGTYGDTSQVENFTITAASGASGEAVQGVVYEIISGANTPISGASIFIYNTTWSSTQITGSNGYYFFNVANGTYYIKSTKTNYIDSDLQIVNISGSIVTQDILMKRCESGFECQFSQLYVKFSLRKALCIFDCDPENVNIVLYEGTSASALLTGITGADGSYTTTIPLTKGKQYRVVLTNTSQGISLTETITVNDPDYIFILWGTNPTWEGHTVQQKDAVLINVTKSTNSSTKGWINVTYNDSLAQTTSLWIYVNQTNKSDPYNQTVIASWTCPSSCNSTAHNFTITNWNGQNYLVHIKAVHTTYVNIDQSYSVQFDKTLSVTGIPAIAWTFLAVIVMFFTGAVFTARTAEKGLLIVCVEGWIFLWMGFFAPINTVMLGISLTLTTIISIFALIGNKKKEESWG